jgi:hypothetical protein
LGIAKNSKITFPKILNTEIITKAAEIDFIAIFFLSDLSLSTDKAKKMAVFDTGLYKEKNVINTEIV